MYKVFSMGLLFLIFYSGCTKKPDENELREIQRKADSVNRHKALEEKLKLYDSLALQLDSAKIK
ncbi:MAG TPA: hypothetical protein PK605_13910 [Ignavibacteria bacterium]|nr:hypothetical protein [Ignavibacteria bacterium]HRE09924.1 hypothetical protein [Ignavibacteria bacterium]HRF66388.1 hypothetical protein [Ignavibacteria bacterium]HRJ05492.1 hypothetical protein [Ignavibacteria bacterium]HRJ85836.1 hypothetical protein [Ignavibacteria bacterium]